MKIHTLPNGMKQLERDPGIVDGMRDAAVKVRRRVVPRGAVLISTRAGVSARGAFSQVIMTGPGAVAIEFGTEDSPPLAPLRRALGGGI